MSGAEAGRRGSCLLSVSRSLQAVAAVLLLLIIGATVHELMTLRSAIVADTAQQMARLDMVFAEQTGRAVETVDFILRNAVESWQTERAQNSADPAAFGALLARQISGVRQLTELAITDTAGHVIVSSSQGTPEALPAAGMTALAFHIANPKVGLRFSTPFRGANGKWTALLTRGITDANGGVTGIAVASLNLAYFEEFYRAVELRAILRMNNLSPLLARLVK